MLTCIHVRVCCCYYICSLEADFARLCKESLGDTTNSLRTRKLPASFFTFPQLQSNASAAKTSIHGNAGAGPAVNTKPIFTAARVHAVKAVSARAGIAPPTKRQTVKGMSLQKTVFMPIAHCSPVKKDRKRTPSPGGIVPWNNHALSLHAS